MIQFLIRLFLLMIFSLLELIEVYGGNGVVINVSASRYQSPKIKIVQEQ